MDMLMSLILFAIIVGVIFVEINESMNNTNTNMEG